MLLFRAPMLVFSALALCVAVVASPSLAQPRTNQAEAGHIEAVQNEIAAQRELMGKPDISSQQRLVVLKTIIRLRREKLIESHPADPRLASWLADQASDLYFELLPTDAAGITALFGLPSPAQLARARSVAERMNELTARAEIAVEQAMLSVESDPAYADDLALQQLRRNLDRDERRSRIPFLRGIAAFLHAELNARDADERAALYKSAADLLEPLGEKLDDPLAHRALVHAGLARLRLNEFETAEALFQDAVSNQASHPADVFAARAGGVLATTIRQGPEAGLAALDTIEDHYAMPESIFYRVLIADQRFLLRREIARSAEPSERIGLMGRAFASYIDLLNRALGIDRQTMRTIVFARLRLAVDEHTPLAVLPPIVTLARAEGLAQEPDTRDEAIGLLERLVERNDLQQEERISAMENLGRALAAAGRPVQAVSRLVELAEVYPRSARTAQAVELAARIASRHHHNSPGNRAARETLDRVINLIIEKHRNLASIGRWRYLAGRLAIDDSRYEDAIALFEQIKPNSDTWLDAQFMKTSARRAAARNESDPVAKVDRCDELLTVTERVRPALEHGLNTTTDLQRTSSLRYYLSYLRVFEAEALTELNRPDHAVEALAGIEETADLDSAVLAAALQARIEAHQRAGRDDQARRELQSFVQTAPDRVPVVMKPMLADIQRDVENLLQQGRVDLALSRARHDLLPLAELLHGWLNANRHLAPEEHEALWRQTADAYRLGERFETALTIYDQLLQRRPDALELLLGRAECLFGLGEDQLAEAMTIYKRIAASGTGETANTHRAYWQSQLRMLQILDLAQRGTHQIVPRIRRLRQQDPNLGGRQFKRHFQRLENKYV